MTAMLFAVAMTFIDQTIVAIAAPQIQGELGLSSDGVQWIINGYLLSLAAFFALGGRLSDMLGHKAVALTGVVIFAASSALCGLTPATSYAEPWIITFRVVQGAGAALMFPAALAIVVAAFPPRQRGSALAIFFAVSGGLTAIGPLAGGYLTQWTWRAIFWVNIPVAIVAVVLTLLATISTDRRRAPIDWLGALLIAAGMALSVLGFQQSNSWGWSSAWTWLCIVGGLLLLVAFVGYELRAAHPLIQVRIFADRAFSVDNGVLFFAMMAFVPVFFFISLYSQISLGYSATNTGLFMLWFFLGFAVASQIGGHILDRFGARWTVTVGTLVGAAGFALWAWKCTDLNATAQVPYIVTAGAGIGLLLGPASTDAVNRAIDASYGEVTGVTQTIRNYGSAVGLAVLGTLLLHVVDDRVVASLTALGVPAGQAQQAVAGYGAGTTGGTDLSALPAGQRQAFASALQQDFAQAVQVVFYGMALALVVAFVVSLWHPGGVYVDPNAPVTDSAPATGRADVVRRLLVKVGIGAAIFVVVYFIFDLL